MAQVEVDPRLFDLEIKCLDRIGECSHHMFLCELELKA